MAKKRVGVILAGSGNRDGSDIHEAALTLLAIDRAGAEALCFAPAILQRAVFNFLTGDEVNERRGVLEESARIARGNVRDLALADAGELDALIIPGGRGLALNMSTFFDEGAACSVYPELSRVIQSMVEAKKPIGAICIAPMLLARVLQRIGVRAVLTAGEDEEDAAQIRAMGHMHER